MAAAAYHRTNHLVDIEEAVYDAALAACHRVFDRSGEILLVVHAVSLKSVSLSELDEIRCAVECCLGEVAVSL